MKFKAGVDKWVVWVLAFSILLMLGVGVAASFDSDVDLVTMVILWGSNLSIIVLVWVLAIPVEYEVADGVLRIRSGLMRTQVNVRDVVRMAPHTSFVSSTTAAWTRHRIRIATRQGRWVDVGPEDQVGFLAEMLAWGPHLVERKDGPRRLWVDPTA